MVGNGKDHFLLEQQLVADVDVQQSHAADGQGGQQTGFVDGIDGFNQRFQGIGRKAGAAVPDLTTKFASLLSPNIIFPFIAIF